MMDRQRRRSPREQAEDVKNTSLLAVSSRTASVLSQTTHGEMAARRTEQPSLPPGSSRVLQTLTTSLPGVHGERLLVACSKQDGSVPLENGACPPPANQVARNRRREQARRHLAQSLRTTQTVLPSLRRTQTFNVTSRRMDVTWPRETESLKHRCSDEDKHAGLSDLRRTKSLKETSGNGSPPLPQCLARPARQLDINSLVHDLNASLKYPPVRLTNPEATNGRRNSESESDVIDTFDSDLLIAPWQAKNAIEAANRALTPALRKLNRRRLSSRFRTQQWVNQIETDCELSSDRERQKVSPPENASGLIYEQKF